MRRFLTATIILLAISSPSLADLKLHPLFTDRGVLQRGRGIVVWGTADAGADVTVSFRQERVTGKADETGKWKIELPEQKAGGPDDLVVTSNSDKTTVHDVMVGDVWICSGQSNMEWTLRKAADADSHIAA